MNNLQNNSGNIEYQGIAKIDLNSKSHISDFESDDCESYYSLNYNDITLDCILLSVLPHSKCSLVIEYSFLEKTINSDNIRQFDLVWAMVDHNRHQRRSEFLAGLRHGVVSLKDSVNTITNSHTGVNISSETNQILKLLQTRPPLNVSAKFSIPSVHNSSSSTGNGASSAVVSIVSDCTSSLSARQICRVPVERFSDLSIKLSLHDYKSICEHFLTCFDSGFVDMGVVIVSSKDSSSSLMTGSSLKNYLLCGQQFHRYEVHKTKFEPVELKSRVNFLVKGSYSLFVVVCCVHGDKQQWWTLPSPIRIVAM